LPIYNSLFLDRDGVVNQQIIGGYVLDYDSQFVFNPGVVEALRLLRPLFRRLILVTNQQCVGKGLCTEDDIRRVHDRMQAHLRSHACNFDAIYHCPHLAAEHCACRKPAIGMALQAKQDFPDIDFPQSLMAGDSLTDIQFARNAGITPVHVGVFHPSEQPGIELLTPHHFDSLLDLAVFLNRKDAKNAKPNPLQLITNN